MNNPWEGQLSRMMIAGAGLCVVMLLTACAGQQPKPMAQPTPDQVRSHADRTFEKLKQEEQERAAQPPVPR
jgi:hypothetical protein